MRARRWTQMAAVGLLTAAAGVAATARGGFDDQGNDFKSEGRRAKNVMLVVGDGMGVFTVTAGRIFSVVCAYWAHTGVWRTVPKTVPRRPQRGAIGDQPWRLKCERLGLKTRDSVGWDWSSED